MADFVIRRARCGAYVCLEHEPHVHVDEEYRDPEVLRWEAPPDVSLKAMRSMLQTMFDMSQGDTLPVAALPFKFKPALRKMRRAEPQLFRDDGCYTAAYARAKRPAQFSPEMRAIIDAPHA